MNPCTRVLSAATTPLALSVTLDFYLIARLISGEIAFTAVAAVLILGVAMVFWEVMPRVAALRGLMRR